MRKYILALVMLALSSVAVSAAQCQYNTTAPTGTAGEYLEQQCDVGGNAMTTTFVPGATLSTSVTREANHTAYTAADAIANSATAPTAGGFTLTGACRISGGRGVIEDIIITTSDDAAAPLQGKIFIFDQAVTAVNDQDPFVVSDAEARTLVEVQAFTVVDIGNQGAVKIAALNTDYTCIGSANLRFLLQATNAYDPAANSEVIQVRVKVRYLN